MYNYTNFTVFFITEFKYRIFYISLNFIVIITYCLYNINSFLLFFLKPLEYLNLDLDYGSYISIIFFLLDHLNSIDNQLHLLDNIENISVDNFYAKFDYFPCFEINSKSGSVLYFFFI